MVDSKTSPTVSVAIATYNGEDYLSEQLDSILNQSRSPDEIIITDDCSTDRTPDVLSHYEAEYPDIISVFENEENVGVTKNFSKSIQLTSGDLIFLSDQDDVWSQDKIKTQIQTMYSTNSVLSFHNSTLVTEDKYDIGDFWSSLVFSPTSIQESETWISSLLFRNFIQGATIAMDHRLKKQVLPIPEQWEHDYYIALKAALVGSISVINKELMMYRQHGNQVTGSPAPDTVMKIHNALQNGKENYNPDPEKWVILMKEVESMSEDELRLPSQPVIDILESRIRFERNRRVIYRGGSNYTIKTTSIAKNLLNGRYSQFGYGPFGLLSTVRDIISSFP
ncbi:family 2 glycosyl transferase [Halogeometricum pallidum JCM 14848]|uniref:Family 2 glycosyl transferase n=2 Tax=Halogeometricum TaxID=60846 RepID=M0D962_HALPD|nr:family 2 glycosyl transferase [Halogeometricum pallidum JCM 14848]